MDLLKFTYMMKINRHFAFWKLDTIWQLPAQVLTQPFPFIPTVHASNRSFGTIPRIIAQYSRQTNP